MSDWLFTAKRVDGDVNICTLYGAPVVEADVQQGYGGAISRHHIIDIQMLQKFWNAVAGRAVAGAEGLLALG